MTGEEAAAAFLAVVENKIKYSRNADELRELRNLLISLQRHAAIEYLANNYSISELREMGWDF